MPAYAASSGDVQEAQGHLNRIFETNTDPTSDSLTLAVDGLEGPRTKQALCGWRHPMNPRGSNGDLRGLQPGELTTLAATTMLRPPGQGDRYFIAHEGCNLHYDAVDGRWGQIGRASTGTSHDPITGRSHRTPRGWHTITPRVVSLDAEGWHESSLYSNGMMYRPLYLDNSAIAIHGSRSVPASRVSHGCIRVTPAAQDYILRHFGKGDRVLVY